MNVNHVIPVEDGQALKALRSFLKAWWEHYQLSALLAPVELPAPAGGSAVACQVVEAPSQLARVNPFAPAMTGNAAALVSDYARQVHGRHAAALLRPCELRALVELRSQRRLPPEVDGLVLMGVDCMGTYPADEYQRRVEARGVEAVTREALAFAGQGGFSPQRLRSACQACDWPAPRGADITVGVLGLAGQDCLLVIARDEATDSRLGLEAVTAGHASEAQAVRREMAVGAVADLRARARAERDAAGQFSGLGQVLAWFANCSLCGDCLDACPLYNGELSGLLGVHGARPLLTDLVRVGRWLAACSGCGMCETACSQDVPLMQLIGGLRQQIQHELRYAAGDPARRLPWAS